MSIDTMTDGAASLTVVENTASDRRDAEADLLAAVRHEHEAVWTALDAGASWRDLAWLVGEPLGTLYHRHRDRGRPRVGRVA